MMVMQVEKSDSSTTPIKQTLKVNQTEIRNNKHNFTEVVVMIVGSDGKSCMERGLLDTGCSKSIILKKSTDKKQQNNLEGKYQVTCKTYGSKFKSSLAGMLFLYFILYIWYGYSTLYWRIYFANTVKYHTIRDLMVIILLDTSFEKTAICV